MDFSEAISMLQMIWSNVGRTVGTIGIAIVSALIKICVPYIAGMLPKRILSAQVKDSLKEMLTWTGKLFFELFKIVFCILYVCAHLYFVGYLLNLYAHFYRNWFLLAFIILLFLAISIFLIVNWKKRKITAVKSGICVLILSVLYYLVVLFYFPISLTIVYIEISCCAVGNLVFVGILLYFKFDASKINRTFDCFVYFFKNIALLVSVIFMFVFLLDSDKILYQYVYTVIAIIYIAICIIEAFGIYNKVYEKKIDVSIKIHDDNGNASTYTTNAKIECKKKEFVHFITTDNEELYVNKHYIAAIQYSSTYYFKKKSGQFSECELNDGIKLLYHEYKIKNEWVYLYTYNEKEYNVIIVHVNRIKILGLH